MNTRIIILFITVLFLPVILNAQKSGVIVQGTVISKNDGYPLVGVNVTEIDATNRVVSGTVTDIDGKYVLRIKNTSNKLVYKYIGYNEAERKIGDLSKIDIALTERTTLLKDVTIIPPKRHAEGGFSIPQREVATAIQSISMKEVEGIQVGSVDEALQGRIAGLDIVSNSGDPGSGSSMRIRGASSITGNNQPLIVLNGVPYEMQVDQSFDYANSNQEQYANLLSINPDDILEISVLKDAAASAVWGSKGANGVIMITTKKGSSGPTRIEYSFRYTGTIQPRGLKMLNGDDYTMLMKQAFFNPAQDENASNFQEYNYNKLFSEFEQYNNNTDWVKAVTQIGNINDHYLTLSGGGERATYRISGGFMSQNGTVIGQEYKRLSSRAYLDYRVSDKLRFITELSYAYSDNDRSYNFLNSGTPNDKLSILGIAYKKMPNVSIYEQNTSGVENKDKYYSILPSSGLNTDQRLLVNPVALAKLGVNNMKNYRILPTFRLQYDFFDNKVESLKYRMYVSFDINNDKTTRFLPGNVTSLLWNHGFYNRIQSGDSEALTVQTDNNLSWETNFGGDDHYLLTYGSIQTTEGRSTYQGNDSHSLPTELQMDPSSPSFIDGLYTSRSHWRSVGYLLRAHYSYKSKYIISTTFRRDGSTKFGDGMKFGNFPGISLKWIASDEAFLKGQDWLSMLAFRPGWGLAGNQPQFEYLHFSLYRDYGGYIDMSAQGPVTIQLKNLKWETTSSFNYGIDLGLFDDKIQADINIYTKKTKDLLFKEVSIPKTSGFAELSYQNAGTMDNSGWEINLFANRLFAKKNFSVDFRFNIANSVNRIESLKPEIMKKFNSDFNYENGSYLTRIQEGNSFGSIYGFKYKGVYQYDEYKAGIQENAPVAKNASDKVILDEEGEPIPMMFAYGRSNAYKFRGGDAIYEDVNHDGSIDELDIVYLGNSNPLFNGGFGPTIKYKTLSFTAFFNFRVGNKIVNMARMHAENMYSTNNQSIAVNWRWRTDGDITNMPRALYLSGYNWLGSDRFVEDGSFLRLKYLTFNYAVPREKLKMLKIERLSLYATLNNLFVLSSYTGVDPEVGYGSIGVSEDWGQTPRSKDLTIGVTVGF